MKVFVSSVFQPVKKLVELAKDLRELYAANRYVGLKDAPKELLRVYKNEEILD